MGFDRRDALDTAKGVLGGRSDGFLGDSSVVLFAVRENDGFNPGALIALKCFGSIVGDDLPLVDDEDAIAGALDFAEVMSRENDGPLLPELADKIADLRGLVGVEAGQRLVENQDGRLVDERLGQPDALTVPFGEGSDFFADDVAEGGCLGGLLQTRAGFAAAETSHFGHELEVLKHHHLGV